MIEEKNYLKKGTMIFNTYTITCDEPIGRGSNWIVYLCQDIDGHLFCIKEYCPLNMDFVRDENGFLRCNPSVDNSLQKRMESSVNHELEMQNAARVEFIERDESEEITKNRTNWDAVYSASKLIDSRFGDTIFVVMDILSGDSLSSIIDKGFKTKIDAIHLLIEIGKTISLLHNKGILHLDIKPENLFITVSGKVIILDFGSAIFKGKHYTEYEVKNTGIGCHTNGFASSEVLEIWEEGNVNRKIELLSNLNERSDIFAFIKISKIILGESDNSIKKMEGIFAQKKENALIKDYVGVLEDRIVAEYHSIESKESLIQRSEHFFNRLNTIGRYYSFLAVDSRTKEEVDIDKIVQSKKSIIIMGGEGTGKTTLLMQCWKKLLIKDFIVAYVDFRNVDMDDQVAFASLIRILKLDYHIVPDKNNDYKVVVLCDNVFSCKTVKQLIDCVQEIGIRLILTTSNYLSEQSVLEDEEPYHIGQLTIEQKRRFFAEYANLYENEIKSGDDYNRILTVSDLIVTRKLKRKHKVVDLNSVSIAEERLKLLMDEEHAPVNKVALTYGYEHFLPWLAIQLYFDRDFLFVVKDESIEVLQERIPDYPFLIQSIMYYMSIGIICKKNNLMWQWVRDEYDKYTGEWIVSYKKGYRIGFAKENEFCYFVAKYILKDYRIRQQKKDSLLCKYQFNYSVIRQLSYLVDIESLEEWLEMDQMSTYRYACRNIMAIIMEKGLCESKIKAGVHMCYDEAWPELDEIESYVDLSGFSNTKKLHLVRRDGSVHVFYGNESSVIDIESWMGMMSIRKNQRYSNYPTMSLQSAGLKRVFHLQYFEITDKMEGPCLAKVDSIKGLDRVSVMHWHENYIFNTGIYKIFENDRTSECDEIIDVYDQFDKTYALIRSENPMRKRTADVFSVFEMVYDENQIKVVPHYLFEDFARFSRVEFPIRIKGCKNLIAWGEVSSETFEEKIHRTFSFNKDNDCYDMIRFYYKDNENWYRDTLYKIDCYGKIKNFDVMDIDEDKADAFYLLNDGKLYGNMFKNVYDGTVYSESQVMSFALLKNLKEIAILDMEGYFKILDLQGTVKAKMNVSKYKIKLDSLTALDDELLWTEHIDDPKSCFILSRSEMRINEFCIPFKS